MTEACFFPGAKIWARIVRWIVLSFLFLLVSFSLAAGETSLEGKSPGDTVRVTVERVQDTVKQQEKKLTAEALEKELRQVISPVFDFDAMARSSLAQFWQEATAEQQQEFVKLFSDLLAHTYLKRIRENAANSAFQIVGEKAKEDKAVVQTKVAYAADQTATIDYRLRRNDARWRVYDVIIENIGLVGNYRSEFASIIKKDKIEGLLKRLREKSVAVKGAT